MVKKISAIVLAIVLCLGIVVMPVTAYELGENSKVAYEIKLDKDNYKPGDTVTVSVFVYGKDGMEYATNCAMFIGTNSAHFDQSANAVANIKSSSTSSATMSSWYKPVSQANVVWPVATVVNNIAKANTAEENAMFNQYVQINKIAKATSGTHPNFSDKTRGLPASEVNADAAKGTAFFTFQLKLKDDIAAGTDINVGIPTGTFGSYTVMTYIKDPGNATTAGKTTAAESETVFATARVTAAEQCAEHTWNDGVVKVEETCAKDGAKVFECTVCKAVRNDVVPATGNHTPDEVVIENEELGDCITDKTYDNVVYCTVCKGEISRKKVTVTALGHTPGEVVIENKVEAKCEEDGSYDEVVYCTVCNDEISRTPKTIDALKHKMVETTAAKESTCKEAGMTAILTCENGCGKTEGGEELPLADHSYVEITRSDATCWADGVIKFKCSVCDKRTSEPIPMVPHTEVAVPAVEPTCTDPGREAGIECSKCYAKIKTGAEIPAKGHTETNVVVVAPTYQDKGYTEFYCPDCDKTFKKDYTDKLEANFTVAVKVPESTTVANSATVVLEAEVTGGEYTGLSLVWTVVEGEGIFECVQTEDGKFEITAVGDGEATFVVELVDEDGNKYGSDTIKMTAEPDFLTKLIATITSLWDKLLAFIMSLIMG